MPDVLAELRLLLERGTEAPATVRFAIEEIVSRRQQVTDVQTRCTELLLENRDLKAIVGGHPVVRIKRMGSPDLPLPRYETEGAAGMDLRADLLMWTPFPFGAERERDSSGRFRLLRIHPGARIRLPCGFAFEIPEGFEGQVRARSSLTDRGALCPTGTIDSDFRGVVSIPIWNLSPDVIEISQGDRIATFVIGPAPQARIEEAEELSATVRGAGGYGSTGVR
jgi:dUTP pyrophosphatase